MTVGQRFYEFFSNEGDDCWWLRTVLVIKTDGGPIAWRIIYTEDVVKVMHFDNSQPVSFYAPELFAKRFAPTVKEAFERAVNELAERHNAQHSALSECYLETRPKV